MEQREWTRQEDFRLFTMALSGKRVREMAEHLNRSEGAVVSRMRELGITEMKRSLGVLYIRSRVEAFERVLSDRWSKLDFLDKKIERLKLAIEGTDRVLGGKLGEMTVTEELIDRINRLRLKMAKLCLRYPGLANVLGIPVDGLPSLLVREREEPGDGLGSKSARGERGAGRD